MFKPVKNLFETIKNYLLEGYILKVDGGASNFVLLIPRSQMNERHVKDVQVANLCYNKGYKYEGSVKKNDDGTIMVPRISNIYDVMRQLQREGYSVCDEDVYSGACQYHTEIYYLIGE